MTSEPLRMTRVYLALWKALDIHFPGHALLEITDEKAEDILKELEEFANEDMSEWIENPTELRQQIESTILRIKENPKEQSWYSEARILKEFFRDKALEYAAKLPEPPARYLTAINAAG